MKVFLKHILPPVAIAGVFVGLWYIVSLLLIPKRVDFILPPPHEVVNEGILDFDALSKILLGLVKTAQVTIVGLVIAAALGIFIAILMSQARWVERTIFPYAIILQAVPIVAVVPLIALLSGHGFTSKVSVTIMISIFPIITNTLFGLRSIGAGMNDLFRLHSHQSKFRTRFQRITKLQFKNAIPSMFVGLKIAAGLAVVGTLVAEYFFQEGAQKNLGRLIYFGYNPTSGQSPELFTAIGVTCLWGLALFGTVGLLGKYFTRHTIEVAKSNT